MGRTQSLKLGEILLNADKITKHHLVEGIEKQKRYKKKIGEIFVMMGLISPEELNLFLVFQKALSEIDFQNVKVDLSLFRKVEALGLLVKKMEHEKNRILSPKDIN